MDAPSTDRLTKLSGEEPFVVLRDLCAGYGTVEIVHGFTLILGKGESLCIIGPNGSGKSTVLHAMFGLADIHGGTVEIAGSDVTKASASAMLTRSKAAYVMQKSSIFPDMTVEENLFMGGFLLESRGRAEIATERIFDEHPELAKYRSDQAGVLSGGQRRVLEVSRALMLEPEIVVIDEPSIGLEPRAVETIFSLLGRLQREEQKTIILVEQNAKKGLEFADIGYVLVSGRVALADAADKLLRNPRVGRLFLGGR